MKEKWDLLVAFAKESETNAEDFHSSFQPLMVSNCSSLDLGQNDQ